MCLILFQCLQVREELYLACKFIENAILSPILLTRYISASIELRYGTSGSSNSLLSSRGLKYPFSHQVTNNHWCTQSVCFIHIKSLKDLFCVS